MWESHNKKKLGGEGKRKGRKDRVDGIFCQRAGCLRKLRAGRGKQKVSQPLRTVAEKILRPVEVIKPFACL